MAHMVLPSIGPKPTVKVDATTSTGNVKLATISATSNAGPVLVTNSGSVLAFVNFGGSTVQAASTNTPILPSSQLVIDAGLSEYAAAITASSTATVYFTPLGD